MFKKTTDWFGQTASMDLALLIARFGIGFLMLMHGIPKMEKLFSGDPVMFPSIFGLGAEISLMLAVFTEVLCSIFIIVGFLTRFAAIPLIITMLVAIFMVHGADPFAKQELAVIYLLVYVFLFIGGSGKYSTDQLLSGRNKYEAYKIPEPAIERLKR